MEKECIVEMQNLKRKEQHRKFVENKFNKFMNSNPNDKINYDIYCQKRYADIISSDYTYKPLKIEPFRVDFDELKINDKKLSKDEYMKRFDAWIKESQEYSTSSCPFQLKQRSSKNNKIKKINKLLTQNCTFKCPSLNCASSINWSQDIKHRCLPHEKVWNKKRFYETLSHKQFNNIKKLNDDRFICEFCTNCINNSKNFNLCIRKILSIHSRINHRREFTKCAFEESLRTQMLKQEIAHPELFDPLKGLIKTTAGISVHREYGSIYAKANNFDTTNQFIFSNNIKNANVNRDIDNYVDASNQFVYGDDINKMTCTDTDYFINYQAISKIQREWDKVYYRPGNTGYFKTLDHYNNLQK